MALSVSRLPRSPPRPPIPPSDGRSKTTAPIGDDRSHDHSRHDVDERTELAHRKVEEHVQRHVGGCCEYGNAGRWFVLSELVSAMTAATTTTGVAAASSFETVVIMSEKPPSRSGVSQTGWKRCVGRMLLTPNARRPHPLPNGRAIVMRPQSINPGSTSCSGWRVRQTTESAHVRRLRDPVPEDPMPSAGSVAGHWARPGPGIARKRRSPPSPRQPARSERCRCQDPSEEIPRSAYPAEPRWAARPNPGLARYVQSTSPRPNTWRWITLGSVEAFTLCERMSVMPTYRPSGRPTTRRYSDYEKAQAVRLVCQLRDELGMKQGTVKRVAEQLGYGVESVRA